MAATATCVCGDTCDACGESKRTKETEGWQLCYDCWTKHEARKQKNDWQKFIMPPQPQTFPSYELTWTVPYTVTFSGQNRGLQ